MVLFVFRPTLTRLLGHLPVVLRSSQLFLHRAIVGMVPWVCCLPSSQILNGFFPMRCLVSIMRIIRAIAADCVRMCYRKQWHGDGKNADHRKCLQACHNELSNLTILCLTDRNPNVPGSPFDQAVLLCLFSYLAV